MHEVHELFVCLYHLHRTEVDATQHNAGLFRRFDVCLQGRLTVKLDGEIDHIASLHQTVRRCIRPSASDINTYGRTSPDYLIVSDTERRLLLISNSSITKAFAKKGKSLFAIAEEHRIVDARHQRSILT